jgi:hypothetical protein
MASPVATDIPADELTITEGSLLIIHRKDIMTLEAKFSLATRFVMYALLRRLTAGETLS